MLKPIVAKSQLTANLATPGGRIADLFRSHWGRAPESLAAQADGLKAAQASEFGLRETPTPWGGWPFDAQARSIVLEQVGVAVNKLGALDPNAPATWPEPIRHHLNMLYTGDAPLQAHTYSPRDARALGPAERTNLIHALLVEGDFHARLAVEKTVQAQGASLTGSEISAAVDAHRFATRELFGTAPTKAHSYETGMPSDNELHAGKTANVSVLKSKGGALNFYFALPSHPGFAPLKAAQLLLSGSNLQPRGNIERVGGKSDGHPSTDPQRIGTQEAVSYAYAFEAVPKSRPA